MTPPIVGHRYMITVRNRDIEDTFSAVVVYSEPSNISLSAHYVIWNKDGERGSGYIFRNGRLRNGIQGMDDLGEA